MEKVTIIDGYTDEPSGLGVPPYLGVYPRYIAGLYPNATYLTIDDLRARAKGLTREQAMKKRDAMKTNISIYNLTAHDVEEVLMHTDTLICIVGVQTPGKYLSARPATLGEMKRLTKAFRGKKLLAGPAISEHGSQMMGRKAPELQRADEGYELMPEDRFSDYAELARIAPEGACIAEQFPKPCIAEIEISRGCFRDRNCSFCTEPLSGAQSFRKQEDIIAEMKALYDSGVRHFRLGRTTCFYSYMQNSPQAIEKLFRGIWKTCPDIEVLHIDNANPAVVARDTGPEITRLICKYCTEGNIAAFGCETFDPDLVLPNNLNATPEISMKAIRTINEQGAGQGPNGMPRFLPGINLIYGLIGENKTTHEKNLSFLEGVIAQGYLLRRINIRQVVAFPGTQLYQEGRNKFIRKNQRHYYQWRNEIRQKVDVPMLEKVFPIGTIIRNVLLEIYDGKTTFGRQLATYPVVIGVKGRHPLRTFCDVRITGHMKRSLIAQMI